MNLRSRLALALVALSPAVAGCAGQQKVEPAIASSTDQYGYAARYPGQLAEARGQLDAYENEVQIMTARFSNYATELDKPDWSKVTGMVDRADAAGRSSEYVAAVREGRTVAGFFKDEKEPISKKVAGAAQYAATQKGCEGVEVYGPASTALEKGVEKRLEERLREHNQAQSYIDENQEALGKKNLEKLRDQADEISYASYVVYIAAVEIKVRLKQWVEEEADAVKKTLDQRIQESEATLADAAATEAQKKDAQKNLDAAKEARAQLDSEIQQAQAVLQKIEERIAAIQKQYDDALKALREAIEKKQQEEPAAAAAPKA
jgi:DNA repair exonuclease SbcCD ATPase subunit